jgi:hypothetical protein
MTPWVAAAYVHFYTPAPEDVRACAAVLDLHCVFKLAIGEVRVHIVTWWISVGVLADGASGVSVRKGREWEGNSV